MDQWQPDQLLTGLAVVSIIGVLLLIFGDRPAWWAHVRAWFDDEAHHNAMSSDATSNAAEHSADVVPVPVRDTDTGTHTSLPAPTSTAPDFADTPAVEGGTDWELPRVSRHLGDAELITLLAAQRTPAGKFRFSANAIFGLVGGSRSAVLDQVRAIQNPSAQPPTYPPRSPEQEQARAELFQHN